MKKNVVLDLDNTLISAEAVEDFPFNSKGIKEKAIKFRIHDMDGYYIVFERPNLQKFLDFLFKNYNVSVWTAASKDYALFIIQEIILKKPDRQLQYILFSYHCELSKKQYKYSKKLDMIYDHFNLPGFTNKNTLIVDDLDEVSKANPNNSVHIHAFEILDKKSEYDNVLIRNTIKDIKTVFDKLDN
jgi:TFIIF-interacting CTD phosphatase-like protein